MLNNYKVSRNFVRYPDSNLDEFASHIITSLTSSTVFPAPPVPTAALQSLQETFRNAISAATGDPQDTAARSKAREALEDALRKDANYVESLASHDVEALLSSGYYVNNTNHAQTPLDAPVIVGIENLATTQLLLRLTPISNAKAYQLQTNTNGNGTWTEAGIYTQARRVVLGNLTSGTTYSVRARAIGGSTGSSAWSVPVALMAT